jgi:hypothetical protein
MHRRLAGHRAARAATTATASQRRVGVRADAVHVTLPMLVNSIMAAIVIVTMVVILRLERVMVFTAKASGVVVDARAVVAVRVLVHVADPPLAIPEHVVELVLVVPALHQQVHLSSILSRMM